MNILRVFTLMSVAVLNDAYRNEKDVNIRERILLVRRVRMDNKEAASVSEKEFHRSRWWAYKWLKRFDNAGLEGLKNKHRSGRPPEVSKETSTRIRRELSENQSGWMAKEVMNLIYMKEQESNIMKFTSIDYYIDGVSVLKYPG
jgi:putative transposase